MQLVEDTVTVLQSVTDPWNELDVVVLASTLFEGSKRALFKGDLGRSSRFANLAAALYHRTPTTAPGTSLEALNLGQRLRLHMVTNEITEDSQSRAVALLGEVERLMTRIASRHNAPSRLVHEYLRLAISYAQLEQWRRRRFTVRRFDSVNRTLALLEEAVDNSCRFLGGSSGTGIVPALRELARVSHDSQHQTVLRILTLLTTESALAGRSTGAILDELQSALNHLPVGDRVRFEGKIASALAAVDLSAAEQFLAEATIIARSGELQIHRQAVRDGFAKRYSSCAAIVAGDLIQARKTISGRFWLWEGMRVARLLSGGAQEHEADTAHAEPSVFGEPSFPEQPESDFDFETESDALEARPEVSFEIASALAPALYEELDDDEDGGFESGRFAPGLTRGAESPPPKPRRRSRTRKLKRNVATGPRRSASQVAAALRTDRERESPVAMLYNLRELDRGDPGDLDREEVMTPIMEVREWLGLQRALSSSMTEALQETYLALAERFVQNMVPAVLWQIATHSASTPTRRISMLHRLDVESARAKHWRRRTHALIAFLGDKSITPDVVEVAERIVLSYREAFAGARSLVDIADALDMVHRQAGGASAALCRRGRIDLAFEVVSVASGVLSSYLEANQAGAEFLDALEAFEAAPSGEVDPLLFQLLERELGRGAQTPLIAPSKLAPSETGVLLLHYGVEAVDRCFAMWRRYGSEDCDPLYGWTELGSIRTAVERLRTSIWADPWLFSSEATSSLDSEDETDPEEPLETLYKWLLEPLATGALIGVDEIVAHFGARFPPVPLHAARLDNGYVVEQLGVRYTSTLTARRDPIGLLRRALVCGWDVSVGAFGERVLVRSLLSARGMDVVSPETAAEGLRALQESEAAYDLIHLAGHYLPQQWPSSSASSMVLGSSMLLTADDWLRGAPHADFCFINACATGPIATRMGDRVGLPMAIRARGASGSISTLSEVNSVDAARFAERFYEGLGSGFWETYLATVRSIIREGRHYLSWAPYCFDGWDLGVHGSLDQT